MKNTMLRKISGLLALFMFLLSTGAFAQLDIGIVNTNEVLSNLPERQQIQQQLNSFIQQKQQELQQASTEFQNAVAEYQQNQSDMTQQQREQREKELSQMEQNLNQRQQSIQQEVAQKRQELLGPIFNRIDQAIQAVAEANSLDYVLNETTGNGESIVAYTDEATTNITQQVIDQVKSQSPQNSQNQN